MRGSNSIAKPPRKAAKSARRVGARPFVNKIALALIVCAATVSPVAAQTYPAKTVRVILPYSTGELDASSEQVPAERGAGTRLRDATVKLATSASFLAPAPCTSPGSDPKGSPLSPCDAPRLRDVNVRESAAVPVLIAQASIPSESYPNRTLRVIVPYATGGGTDIMTRVVTQKLSEMWGQQIVVDNRAGGGTVIGTQLAANAPADGYTLFVSAPSFVINPTTRPGLPYDVVRDFKAITIFAYQPYVLVTHPKLPARNVKEFIALAKERPDSLNFGSTGTGSGSHLAAELFKYMTHTTPQHISYKGMGPAVVDVIGGQVQFIFGSVLAVVPHMRTGKLRALGVSSERRSASLPDLPTIAEAGVPGYSTVSWSGMQAPAGVPDAIVKKLNADVNTVIARADVRERFLHDAAEPGGGSTAEFGQFIKDEIVKWRKVIKAADIRID